MKSIGKIAIMAAAATLLSVSCSGDDGPEVKTEGFQAADFVDIWWFNVDPYIKPSDEDFHPPKSPGPDEQAAYYMKLNNNIRFNKDGTWQQIEGRNAFNMEQIKQEVSYEYDKESSEYDYHVKHYSCPALTEHATHEGDILAHGAWAYDTETESVTIDIDESDYVYCVLGRPGGRNHMKPVKKSIKGRYGFEEGDMIVIFDELYYAPGNNVEYWCEGYEATDGWRKLDKASDHFGYKGFEVKMIPEKNRKNKTHE